MSLETFFDNLSTGTISTPQVTTNALSTVMQLAGAVLEIASPATAPIVAGAAGVLSTLLNTVKTDVAAAPDPETATDIAATAVPQLTTAAVNLLLQAKPHISVSAAEPPAPEPLPQEA
jgi:hypothetical protein